MRTFAFLEVMKLTTESKDQLFGPLIKLAPTFRSTHTPLTESNLVTYKINRSVHVPHISSTYIPCHSIYLHIYLTFLSLRHRLPYPIVAIFFMPFWYSCSKRPLNMYGFPIFWLGAYLMKIFFYRNASYAIIRYDGCIRISHQFV